MKFPISRFIISGHSMMPIYKPGMSVITFNWFYNPNHKDVVVVKVLNKLIIKRIKKVEKLRVYLKGDNIADSKEFGWVGKDKIIGKVLFGF